MLVRFVLPVTTPFDAMGLSVGHSLSTKPILLPGSNLKANRGARALTPPYPSKLVTARELQPTRLALDVRHAESGLSEDLIAIIIAP